MFDPLAAIGLAGSIVQFVDFSCKLFDNARELYTSSTRVSTENKTFEEITWDLDRIHNELMAGSRTASLPVQIQIMIRQCGEVTLELHAALDQVRLRATHQKWKSFVRALQGAWSKERIEGLFAKVERLRGEIQYGLQVFLMYVERYFVQAESYRSLIWLDLEIMLNQLFNSEQHSETRKALENLSAENNRLLLDNSQRMESLMSDVRDAISDLGSDPPRQLSTTCEAHELLQALSSHDYVERMHASTALSGLSVKLSTLACEVRSMASNQMLLRSLWFDNIEDRRANVQTAHRGTFEWTSERASRIDFEDWLQNRDGLYWIMGKAGLGKSTLVKFLLKQPRTDAALRSWAHPKRIVIANFFFWKAGSPMQKSQKGLFQSLLFDVLRQCPELIQSVCAAKAEAFQPFERQVQAWTREELWQALGRLRLKASANARFCFFIDGLDEYDGPLEDIIEVLQSLRQWPDIKLCISSRPDNAFTDAFGEESSSHLALEDLTRDDIEKYVRDTLADNAGFRALQAENDFSQSLVTEIVDKARGVFLWVVLVVRSLLKGLSNRDTMQMLLKRLSMVPESLETLFARMIEQIEDVYQGYSAQAFKLALEAFKPLPWMTFSILGEEGAGALEMEKIKISKSQDLISRQERMKRQLLSRCTGLLEIVRDITYDDQFEKFLSKNHPCHSYTLNVDFLHRTAHDFLLTKDMQNQLARNLPMGFEPKMYLCQTFFAQVRALDDDALQGNTSLPHMLFRDLMSYAGRIEVESRSTPDKLLDAVRILMSQRAKVFGWTNGDSGFLESLVQNELCLYLNMVLTRKPQPPVLERNALLRSALCLNKHLHWRGRYNLQMIELLLDNGTLPNSEFEDSTIWGRFVYSIGRKDDYVDEESLLQVLQCLLSHGAKPQQRIVVERVTQSPRPLTGRAADLHKHRSIEQAISKIAQEILTEHFGEEKVRKLLSHVHARWRPFASNLIKFRF